MIAKALIVALCACMCFTGVSGEVYAKRGHHKHHERHGRSHKPRHDTERPIWYVYDELPPVWTEAIKETIDDWNGIDPATGPLLVYVKGQEAMCETEVMHVCGGDGLLNDGRAYWGVAIHLGDGEMETVMNLTDPNLDTETEREGVMCHEFAHHILGVDDNYHAIEDGSCVWGSLTDPGWWDIQQYHERWG